MSRLLSDCDILCLPARPRWVGLDPQTGRSQDRDDSVPRSGSAARLLAGFFLGFLFECLVLCFEGIFPRGMFAGLGSGGWSFGCLRCLNCVMRISDVFILRANLIAGLCFVPTNLLSLRYVAVMFVAEILSEL